MGAVAWRLGLHPRGGSGNCRGPWHRGGSGNWRGVGEVPGPGGSGCTNSETKAWNSGNYKEQITGRNSNLAGAKGNNGSIDEGETTGIGHDQSWRQRSG